VLQDENKPPEVMRSPMKIRTPVSGNNRSTYAVKKELDRMDEV
jgi:hypothetical protein